MIVFDTAYTYRTMVDRDLFDLITCRDLNGYFDHVWTVHPVATINLPDDDRARYGLPTTRPVNERHTHIEGKIGRFHALRRFPKFNFLLAQIALLRLMLGKTLRRRVGVIRAEDAQYNGLLALILSRLTRRPMMIGIWGHPGRGREHAQGPTSRRLFKTVRQEESFEGFILRRASVAMAQNEFDRSYLLDRGVPPEKTAIFRLGNALNPTHFTDPSERESGKPDLEELGVVGVPTLLTICRLERIKLPEHVVLAVKELSEQGVQVKAIIAGDGSLHRELTQMATELGIPDSIILCGNRDQAWLARVAPEVDVIVSPATGRALVEAALSGTPIAAYDLDWQREFIEQGVTGELVPYKDYRGMARSIEHLLRDRQYAARVGAQGRQRALNTMSPEVVRREQEAVYDKLLGLDR